MLEVNKIFYYITNYFCVSFGVETCDGLCYLAYLWLRLQALSVSCFDSPALTRSHCQSKAADSEPEPRSESERQVSQCHYDFECQARAQAPCHNES